MTISCAPSTRFSAAANRDDGVGVNRRRIRGAWGQWLRFLGALLIVPFAAYCAGLVWFVDSMPRDTSDDGSATDAIVVLTGGTARVRTGVELLEHGRAGKLLVSGVYRGVDVAELLRVQQRRPEAVECCIVLGYEAESTAGNAREAQAWVAREGISSLRLVTATYHMPRSMLEFRLAMPDTLIVPHAVMTDGFRRTGWWRHPGSLALAASEYHKFIATLVRSLGLTTRHRSASA
jgi:uncharacterized SAM-binding protein YcdF (DUF218 family)